MKFFTIAGPVNPDDHYCLPLATRLNEQELRLLVAQKKYFVLHAPRQTGKTSTMLNFAKTLNAEGQYTALYVNIEAAQAARSDYTKGMASILEEFFSRIKDQLPHEQYIISYLAQLLQQKNFTGASLNSMLSEFARNSSKPLVILIDEIDCLVGDTLISALRQLRAGYDQRPKNFPQSVCLIGVRDVRDYRIWSDEKHAMVLGGSAFNIKTKSLRMADFSAAEVKTLYLQHTVETGQKFTAEAIDYAFEITQGQPWLVNALAQEACFEMITDRTKPITKDIIETAKETLIMRRDTHIDVLVDRLQEPRVCAIIDNIINGSTVARSFPTDDISYVIDLGIVKRKGKDLVIANPMYQEVLPRELTYTTQYTIAEETIWYQNPDKSLNMKKLLKAFTEFYRENSADWLADCKYKESGPHLLMMAFLQRIINGGGKIHREYALGRKRLDLLLTWPGLRSHERSKGKVGKKQKIVIELKVYKDKKTLPEGLKQTADYMDTAGATEGHLIIFDKRKRSWKEKMYTKSKKVGTNVITVWGV